MTETHWWMVRIVAWGVIVGCVLSLVPPSAGVFVVAIVIFSYFALEFWMEDAGVMELDTDEPNELAPILERDCS